MTVWVIAAWAAALLIAVLVLGFCAYEIIWKVNRLRRDAARLQGVADELSNLRTELAAAQHRAAARHR